MPGLFPENKLEEIKNAASIVDVISPFVALKQKGRTWLGLCPFHSEKTPSFTVNPEKQIFHCFGCGVGGNAFSFIMQIKGVSFPEAVRDLAERYGVDLPKNNSQAPAGRKEDIQEIYHALEAALEFFHANLTGEKGGEARRYLADRAIGPAVIKKWQLGWAPEGWDNLGRWLSGKRLNPRAVESAGLVVPRKDGRGSYDRFRGRVICPVRDAAGRLVAFGGRIIAKNTDQPKYLNSPQTPVYNKSRVLFGLDQARTPMRDSGRVIIVEGYFDHLSLASAGVRNVVATCGTALTASHLRLLKGYVEEVILVFDPDAAGRAAAARSLPLFLSLDMEAKVLILPSGQDPDSFIRAFGKEKFLAAVDKSNNLYDFFIEQTVGGHANTPQGKNKAAAQALDMIRQVDGSARKDLLVKDLAHRLGISEAVLRSEAAGGRGVLAGRTAPEGRIRAVANDLEEKFLEFILRHPKAWPSAFERDLSGLFRDEGFRRVYQKLNESFKAFGALDPSGLVNTLAPEEAGKLSRLAVGQEMIEDGQIARAMDDFVRNLMARHIKRREKDLARRIRLAQENADEKALIELMKQKNELMKSKNLSKGENLKYV